jgi:putative transposase
MKRQAQLALSFSSTWGGARKGAGRPPIPGRRRPTLHRARPEHRKAIPVHVTMRARVGLGSFRSPRVFAAVRSALAAASGERFRIIHFSVQSDHLHLIVEANDTRTLARGLLGIAIRVSRRVNRALGRKGPVWGDRYHARSLATPSEVRAGIVYVLMNFRKHRPADRRPFDACSSAHWFDGFREPIPRGSEPSPASRPTTWLLRTGWRRLGLISSRESPAPQKRRARTI